MNYSNILSKVYFLTKTNATSFPIADITILANNAMDRIVSLIMQADGRWEFDDNNQPLTDQGDGTGGLPIATTSIVSGQQDYGFATSHIAVERMEIKSSAGDWSKLIPIDQADVYDQSVTNFMSGGGTPLYYDKIGTSLLLYPTPNYSLAAALKVFFTRPPIYFLTSDTTKSPGFNALYHDIVALWVAYEYAIANALPNASQLEAQIMKKEDALKEDFAMRSKDEHLGLRPRRSLNQFR